MGNEPTEKPEDTDTPAQQEKRDRLREEQREDPDAFKKKYIDPGTSPTDPRH